MPNYRVWCLVGTVLSFAVPAAAQKYPGETLAPITPSAPRVVPRSAPAVLPPPRAAAPMPGNAEPDAQARQLAAQLPLDPGTANLQSQMPADVPGTAGQLGLRVPNGPKADMRGQPVTTPALIDALRH